MDKERPTTLNWGPGAKDMKYYATSRSAYSPPSPSDVVIIAEWESGRSKATSDLVVPPVYQTKVGWERISGSTGSRQTYNPVCHTKLQGINRAYLYYTRAFNVSRLWHNGSYWRDSFPSTLIDIPLSTLYKKHQSRPADLTVRARAWHNMQPRFESDVKLLNTLFELKDFRYATTQLLRSGLKGSLLEDAQRAVNKLLRDVRTDLSRPAAGAWLTYHLAYLPTVKDATAILNQINNTVRDEQRKFAEEGESLQTSHYSENLGLEQSGVVGTRNYYWVTIGTVSQSIFTATLQYTYNYKMRDTVDAWRRYWGLNSSFEAFWNMIPFSFVADYFVGIGRSIRAMEHDPNVDLTSYVYGESIKTTLATGRYINSDTRDMVTCVGGRVRRDAANFGLLLAGYEGTHYERIRTVPYYGPALPSFKVPKTKQFLTMAALVRCIL